MNPWLIVAMVVAVVSVGSLLVARLIAPPPRIPDADPWEPYPAERGRHEKGEEEP